jgi:hypothetical protein
MKKKDDLINFSIKHIGAPIVNAAIIKEISSNIVCIDIDLKSKYCESDMSFSGDDECPGIFITATKESTNLNKKVNGVEPTGLVFNDFKNWEVYATGAGRYTIRVCLIKRK